MKILFITPYPPAQDGIGSYSAMLRGELLAQGYDIAVISARRAEDAPEEVIGSLPPAFASPEAVLEAVRAFAPDVIHVQFAVAAYAALLPSLVRVIDRLHEQGWPIVMTMHEVTRDTESLRAAGRALYRRVATRAARVIVHTETSREALLRLQGRAGVPVSVIAHPRTELPPSKVDASELRARLGLGQDRVILAFGFIDVDKGLDDLIVAASRMPAPALRGVRIAVAGDVRRRFGPFRVFELRDRLHLRRVRRLVTKRGLADKVTFAGFVPGSEVRTWFDVATVAVLPYRRAEQSGVASLAVAAGTPVLTSDVGELAQLSALPAFRPRDTEALAASLERFLATSDVWPGIFPGIDAGGDLSSIVRQTVTLYEELTAVSVSRVAA